MKVEAAELAKQIARELMSEQTKFFQEEMKKMKDEMGKMKEELSKKVEDVISGTSKGNGAKDNMSDAGGDKEILHGRGVYSNTGFDYAQLNKSPAIHFPTINQGKPPHFDRTRYTDWAYKMKMHLIAARLWEFVDVGVLIPTDEDREITLEEAYNLHQNAQAVSLLVSSLGQDEFNKVNGVESAKAIWDILKVSFEGDSSVRKGNIELLQGELERFVFLQGETTQAMFDRLVALVNCIRALGSKEWDDNRVARKMLRTYRTKNNMLASVIMEKLGYDEMTPQELLAKIKHHECLDEDCNNPGLWRSQKYELFKNFPARCEACRC